MVQFYPENAIESLEFDKVLDLLKSKCRTDAARERVEGMKCHVRPEFMARALRQTHEFKNILFGGEFFPNDFTSNLHKELKLLSVEGSMLTADQLPQVRKLALNARDILLYFKKNHEMFPELEKLCERVVFEKRIVEIISAVVDEGGTIRDDASKELMSIRITLGRARAEVRKVFEATLRRLSKSGYLADISESFINGRRTAAIQAEYKRIVRGIVHGESDTGKTTFIEPEETIELNNDIFSLERAEEREIKRILQQTTRDLAQYAPLLELYYVQCGLYDFIRAKALLAVDMNAMLPHLSPHPTVSLAKAYHPLLLLKNKAAGKTTVPLNITLDRTNRILMVSGPNAGGKTVAMKTLGLIQIMAQAGLLVPVSDESEIGIFKQIMVAIGDTQSIEHELSTYSAHLQAMKHFMDFANGKTLFFIDELGSGSDPDLGGAFAEAIVEDLAAKNALGIITTHYLNLKVMAGKVRGIFNGAMAFDETHLEPLYRLETGKPGSSYTFAIAQRSGLPDKVIERARQLTRREHFKLDKILHQTEVQSVRLTEKERDLDKLQKEAAAAKKKFEALSDKEAFRQQQETLKLQNAIKKEELDYLRDTERKFKQIIQDWKRAENKQDVIKSAEEVLFRNKQVANNAAAARKADKMYLILDGIPVVGDLVKNKTTHAAGIVTEVKDKKAVVKIGNLPFTVTLADWVKVKRKEEVVEKQ